MKKRLLSLLAAVAITLSLSACKSSETAQETQTSQTVESAVTVSETIQAAETTAPENDEVIYETLAEGQERDWKIEDVLKNDLEIDGIPISIPCTVEELLDTLGDGYSINKSELDDGVIANVTSAYYTGEYNSLILYNNNKSTLNSIMIVCDGNDNLNVIGFFSGIDKGVITLKGLPLNSPVSQCIDKYGYPDQIVENNGKEYFLYETNEFYFHVCYKNSLMQRVSNVGLVVEEFENE